MYQHNPQYNQPQPYYHINSSSSTLPPLPYQRSISTNDLYQNDIYGPSNNNYFHNIYEERYNPYSKYIPRHYTIEKPIYSPSKRFDRYNYYNNDNKSYRKSPYHNYREVKQGQLSYTPIEQNNSARIVCRNVPIYQQKAIDFDIKSVNNGMNYGMNNRIYSANDRYGGPNYYNNANERMDYRSQYLSSSLPVIPRKKYYDGYSPDMKSEYKDNYIWSKTYK